MKFSCITCGVILPCIQDLGFLVACFKKILATVLRSIYLPVLLWVRKHLYNVVILITIKKYPCICICICISIYTLFKVYYFETEREHKWGGEEREGETIPSRLRTVSVDPATGLELISHEVMTWTEVKRWTLNQLSHSSAPKHLLRIRLVVYSHLTFTYPLRGKCMDNRIWHPLKPLNPSSQESGLSKVQVSRYNNPGFLETARWGFWGKEFKEP